MGIKTKEDLKPLLLDLLGDPDVIKQLKSICMGLMGLRAQPGIPVHPADVHEPSSTQMELEAKVSRLAKMLEETRELNRQKETQLKTLQQEVQQLGQQNKNAEDSRNQAQSRLNQLEQDNQMLRNRSMMPGALKDVIERIRQDADLLERFKLPKQAGDDLGLLISAVATLSHEGNFKRLWELYQSRQQAQRTAIEPADRLVLDTALGWLNINHQDKPHHFDEPAVGLDYKYEQHARAAAGMVGDRIQATWLPGIPTLGLKPQVETA